MNHCLPRFRRAELAATNEARVARIVKLSDAHDASYAPGLNEREAILRGIPVVGVGGGHINGTRPDRLTL